MAQTSGASNLFVPIKYQLISVGEEIGETGTRGGPSGRFKRVCKGTLRSPDWDLQHDVVILKYARIADAEKQREVEILALLAKVPDTPKFMPEIFGSCEEKPERLVVQERAVYGSLKAALSEGNDLREALTPPHRLHSAFQICRAVVFLESLRIVHCDLSCRNCLLFYLDDEDDAGVLVKLTDVGLAVLLPEGCTEITKKQPQAVRWCAPETVAHSILSHKADAWAVGMTIWELWSGGMNPWPKRERRPEISAILRGLGQGGMEEANEELDNVPAPPSGGGELPEPFISLEDEIPVPECHPHGISCPKPVAEVIRGSVCVDERKRKGPRTLMKELGDIIRSLQEVPDQVSDVGQQSSYNSQAQSPPRPRRRVAHNAALTNKESVDRITTNEHICEFAEWALTRWDPIYESFAKAVGRDPSSQALPDANPRSLQGLTKQQWVDMARHLGFRGNAGAIFEEIHLEVVGVDATRLAKAAAQGAHIVETITLPQIKRFEARIAAATSSLQAGDGASPAATFARHLKQIRGTVLRAWRQDLDIRGTGRVAYADFTTACRKLSLSSQARLIWDNLRQQGRSAPLEFHEVAPEEAENMEGFCEILLASYGFDLEKVWHDMDPNNQQYLTVQDFTACARALGFEGNARQIYKGLDSGLGRLLREDFVYLNKVSARGPYGRAPARGPMAELITYVRRESPDVSVFLNKLGITSTQSEIAVNDLAARLTAVGFEGDALQASLKAARSSGGSRVSVQMLRAILSGDRYKDADSEAPSAVLMGTARLRGGMKPFQPEKQAWSDSVDNFSEKNLSKCHSSRMYFGSDRSDDRRSTSGTIGGRR